MTSVDRPEILLISLASQPFFDESYLSLLDNLCNSAHLKRAKTARGAIRYLEANNPSSILVTDEGLTKTKHRAVLDKVASYIRNGGLVIVGLHFPKFTETDVFDKFFNETFGLPWQQGDYLRCYFQLNPSCSLPTGVSSNSFPAPYSMKVHLVKNAQPHEKIFVPEADAIFKSQYVDPAQAAVVGAKVGNGYLAYIGDVNRGEGSDNIILSLCGLEAH